MSKILILTVGLPMSGKTTWCHEYHQKSGAAIVNPDSIRLALHGQRYAANAESYVWAIADTMVKSLFLGGHEVVVVDATNNTWKRRAFWSNSNWDTYCKLMNFSRSTCIQRARRINDSEIVPVIERMANNHEHLREDEQDVDLVDVCPLVVDMAKWDWGKPTQGNLLSCNWAKVLDKSTEKGKLYDKAMEYGQ